jgi:hypothetical protein
MNTKLLEMKFETLAPHPFGRLDNVLPLIVDVTYKQWFTSKERI